MISAGDHAMRVMPYGLMSLRDMINYQVFGLVRFMLILQQQEGEYQQWLTTGLPPSWLLNKPDAVPHRVPKTEIDRVSGTFGFATQVAELLELPAVRDRVTEFRKKARYAMTLDVLVAELRVLRETIDSGLDYKYFYRYGQDKALVLLGFDPSWERAVLSFPSIKEDAKAGVDCWALGHDTAAVFHFMRVSEIGLRALARERRIKIQKRPLEWANWQDILNQLRQKIEEIAKRRPGPAKDAALEFYRGALGEFEAFKDTYRNNVMHVRRSYDEHEAQSVMNHVREFMTRLAMRIPNEKPRAIRWGRTLAGTPSLHDMLK